MLLTLYCQKRERSLDRLAACALLRRQDCYLTYVYNTEALGAGLAVGSVLGKSLGLFASELCFGFSCHSFSRQSIKADMVQAWQGSGWLFKALSSIFELSGFRVASAFFGSYQTAPFSPT